LGSAPPLAPGRVELRALILQAELPERRAAYYERLETVFEKKWRMLMG
jgi:hypothetical protein